MKMLRLKMMSLGRPGENITSLAFERNGGQGYSGTFDGKKFGESPDHNDGLGAHVKIDPK